MIATFDDDARRFRQHAYGVTTSNTASGCSPRTMSSEIFLAATLISEAGHLNRDTWVVPRLVNVASSQERRMVASGSDDRHASMGVALVRPSRPLRHHGSDFDSYYGCWAFRRSA